MAEIFRSEVFYVFLSTTVQATISSLFSLLFGLFTAFGLIDLQGSKRLKIKALLENIYLAPQVLPLLFVILATFQIYQFFQSSPVGFWGVLVIHVLINSGLAAVQWSSALERQIAPLSATARVFGSSFFLFFKKTSPLLLKDGFRIFFTIFIFCFMSFTIPFILGGSQSETVEVFIYRQILSGAGFFNAFILCVMQIMFLSLWGWFLTVNQNKRHEKQEMARANTVKNNVCWSFSTQGFLWPLSLVYIVFGAVTMVGVIQGFFVYFKNPITAVSLISLSLNSLIVSTTAALLTFVYLFVLTYFWPLQRLSRGLSSFVYPSPIFIGVFLFYFDLIPQNIFLAKIELGFILSLLFFIPIFRLQFYSTLEGFNNYIQVARVFGAHRRLIFTKILWPLVLPSLWRSASLVSLWSLGDYAMSLFVLPPDSHLILFMKTLISRYRLDHASFILGLILIYSLFFFLLFKGLENVARRKLN